MVETGLGGSTENSSVATQDSMRNATHYPYERESLWLFQNLEMGYRDQEQDQAKDNMRAPLQ